LDYKIVKISSDNRLEMCPKDTHAPAKCAITLKKAHNSVKNQWVVTQIELDLCFDIIYQHAKYESIDAVFQVIERTPFFVIFLYKNAHTSLKN